MARPKPIRILYIEDDPGLARLVQKRLGRVGYEVDIAADGEEGIAKYEADSYNLMFVDQTLPVYDGLEVIRRLSSQGVLPPTIMITGTGDERVAVEAMKLGAGDYIVKDVEGGYLELLPSVVEKVLDQRRVITEKQRAEEALQENEQQLQTLMDNSPVAVTWADMDGNIQYINHKFQELFGYTLEDIPTTNVWHERAYPDAASFKAYSAQVIRQQEQIKAGKVPDPIETVITCKDGSVRYLAAMVAEVSNRRMATYTDITERKHMEDVLRESEERFRILADNAPFGISVMAPDKTFEYFNPRFTDIFGYTIKDIPNKDRWFAKAYPDEKYRKKVSSVWENDLSKKVKIGKKNPRVFTVRCKNGEDKIIDFRTTNLKNRKQYLVYDDITNRTKAEKALRQSEEKFRQFFENEPEYCYITSPEGIMLDINNAALKTLGYTKEDLVGKSLHAVCVPESLPKLEQIIVQWKKTGIIKEQEICIVGKDRMRHTVLLSAGAVRDEAGTIVYGVAVQRDVTEHKWVEQALQKTEEELRIIVDGASDGFIYLDREGTILLANDRMKEILADPNPEGKLLNTFFDEENQKILARNLMERQEGKGTVYEIELTDAKGRRHNLVISGTPYRDKQGVIQGAFGIYHDVTQERESAKIISEHKKALKNSFLGTTEALAKVIEDRDPYTSGHSIGVAGLAEAIARTMGFSEDDITGIYIAGILHDIGKMAVPVEILVKPGRLTDMEMSLIQIHPKAGYEILKGIDFPWPVTQATLQHHERMDGSGYPQGLKGDGILLEARILAVADVVDAMTHHRPYRPAFSIRNAMDEIKKGRGRIYDPQVVDACLEVLGGEDSLITSEYSTSSTLPQLRRVSKKSSTLPTTTRIRSLGRR